MERRIKKMRGGEEERANKMRSNVGGGIRVGYMEEVIIG